jgi:hypothetical protein
MEKPIGSFDELYVACATSQESTICVTEELMSELNSAVSGKQSVISFEQANRLASICAFQKNKIKTEKQQ